MPIVWVIKLSSKRNYASITRRRESGQTNRPWQEHIIQWPLLNIRPLCNVCLRATSKPGLITQDWGFISVDDGVSCQNVSKNYFLPDMLWLWIFCLLLPENFIRHKIFLHSASLAILDKIIGIEIWSTGKITNNAHYPIMYRKRHQRNVHNGGVCSIGMNTSSRTGWLLHDSWLLTVDSVIGTFTCLLFPFACYLVVFVVTMHILSNSKNPLHSFFPAVFFCSIFYINKFILLPKFEAVRL